MKNEDRTKVLYASTFQAHGWRVGVASTAAGLRRVEFPLVNRKRFRASLRRLCPYARIIEDETANGEARSQITEYLAGRRMRFDLPVDLAGTTSFQRKVLLAVGRIPYGKTLSYGEVAARVGRPKGARAVGAALHNNPTALVIPCHRVIGSDGSLVGFAGGIRVKSLLLELERRILPERRATHKLRTPHERRAPRKRRTPLKQREKN